jgi:hypothetical protein
MAAGPDEVRGSDPNSLQRPTKRVGTEGCYDPRVRPVRHHVSPPLHSPLTSVMQPAERDFGYMAGAMSDCHAERYGGTVRLGSIRIAAIVDYPERQQALWT